jgi:Cu/Ag efflux pump CusA
VYEASKEVRIPILNSTLIIIAGFSPLFFLSGMEGRMLVPLGIAFIVAISSSTLVALTVTPLMCRMMLGSDKYLEKNEKEKWVSRKLSGVYSKSLYWVLNNKKKVLYPTAGLFLITLALFFTMGKSFLPEFNEGSLVISAVTKPGVSLTKMPVWQPDGGRTAENP